MNIFLLFRSKLRFMSKLAVLIAIESIKLRILLNNPHSNLVQSESTNYILAKAPLV